MPAPTIRPAADPLDDIDREASGVDSAMARQDRADLPGERSDRQAAGRPVSGDVYADATREIAEETADPEVLARSRDPELVPAIGDADSVSDDDPELDLLRESLAPAEAGQGADDDDTIDETERAGDDSIR